MPPFPMPRLVGENRQNFLIGMRGQERVVEDDPLVFSEAGKIGVGMTAPAAGVHLKTLWP